MTYYKKKVETGGMLAKNITLYTSLGLLISQGCMLGILSSLFDGNTVVFLSLATVLIESALSLNLYFTEQIKNTIVNKELSEPLLI